MDLIHVPFGVPCHCYSVRGEGGVYHDILNPPFAAPSAIGIWLFPLLRAALPTLLGPEKKRARTPWLVCTVRRAPLARHYFIVWI